RQPAAERRSFGADPRDVNGKWRQQGVLPRSRRRVERTRAARNFRVRQRTQPQRLVQNLSAHSRQGRLTTPAVKGAEPMIGKKICLLGAFAVGKTSLVTRFIKSVYSDRYLTTVGVKVDKKTVNVNGQEINLIIWDLAGEDEFQKVRMP